MKYESHVSCPFCIASTHAQKSVEMIGQGAGAKWQYTVGAPDRYPNDLDHSTGTPPNPIPPAPTRLLEAQEHRHPMA